MRIRIRWFNMSREMISLSDMIKNTEAAEMASWVKCLSYNPEGLRLDPQQPRELGTKAHVPNLRGDSPFGWWETLSQKRGQRATREDSKCWPSAFTWAHAQRRAHLCMHTQLGYVLVIYVLGEVETGGSLGLAGLLVYQLASSKFRENLFLTI